MRRTAYVSLVILMCTATVGCFVSKSRAVDDARVPAATVEHSTTVVAP